ncbi:cation:proton antiporter [Actinophytocola sp. KF-1]
MTLVAEVTVIAPIPSGTMLRFLWQISLLLLLAVVLGRLAVRCRLPALAGELSAGVLLGPSVLGALWPGLGEALAFGQPQQQHLLEAVGQVGVLLLVGITGMHVDLGLARGRSATVSKVSAAGFVLPFAIGIPVALCIPAALVPDGADRATFALFIGIVLGISAIPVIARTLLDMDLLHRDIGQLTMCAVMLNDTAGWVLLAVVSGIATAGLHAHTLLTTAAGLLAAVAGALLLRPLARSVLRRTTGGGPTTGVVCVLVLLGATGTQALGLEAVFGAFVVGLVLSHGRLVRMELLVPLRTTVLAVLSPVFFALAGLRMDLTSLAHWPVLATGAVVLIAAVVGKFAGAYLGARLSRLSHWEGLALGAGMNARGVVEIVIAMVGLRLGLLSPEIYTVVVLIAIVTSLMAPPVLRWAMARVTETEAETSRSARLHLNTTR